MNRKVFGMCSALLLLSSAGLAQAPQMPKPGPELKRLAYFVGDWKSAMELKQSPMGPAAKMTSTDHYEMMPGGFFLLSHSSTKSAMGQIKELAVYGYDSQAKAYTYNAFNSSGEAEHFTGVVDGKTWTWTSEAMMEGKTTKLKFTLVEASPASYTFRFDMQSEGGSWTNVMEGKATKAKKSTTPPATK